MDGDYNFWVDLLAESYQILFGGMTGCVKVVKIGEEGKSTGDVEFNAGDNVANIWDSKALPELEGKAEDK